MLLLLILSFFVETVFEKVDLSVEIGEKIEVSAAPAPDLTSEKEYEWQVFYKGFINERIEKTTDEPQAEFVKAPGEYTIIRLCNHYEGENLKFISRTNPVKFKVE